MMRLIVFLILFLIYPGIVLGSEIYGDYYVLPQKISNKIVSAKTKRVADVPVNDPFVDYSCGGGYFYGSVGLVEKSLLKYEPKTGNFKKIPISFEEDIISKGEVQDVNWYNCTYLKIKSNDILWFNSDSKGFGKYSLFFINGKRYLISGYVSRLNFSEFSVLCQEDVCIQDVKNLSNLLNYSIPHKILPAWVEKIDHILRDKIIMYSSNSYDGSGLLNRGCVLFQDIDASWRPKYRDICSLIHGYYDQEYQLYYNRYYYFFPINIGQDREFYYECRSLKDCVMALVPQEGLLLSYETWFEEGLFAVYGNHTTTVYDGFGPDFLFCIKKSNNKIDRCIKKESNEDKFYEVQNIIYISGEIYFLVLNGSGEETKLILEKVIN